VTVNSVVDVQGASARTFDLSKEVCDQRVCLAARLDAISRSRSELEAVAGRSYWHPNGFAKLVLADDRDRGQLRLHVWPELPDEDDPHGHAWHYRSVVVGGELTEITYTEGTGDAGLPMWCHSYGQVAHRRFTLTDAVPVRLAQSGPPVVHRPGDASGGSPGHIHRFFASAAPAVTMLRVGPVLAPSSSVYRPTPEPRQALAPRPTSLADVARWVDHARHEAASRPDPTAA
jgi:hypothetical protein